MTTSVTVRDRAFVAKKALFSFFGSSFYLYGTDGNLRFYVKQKAFRLKEQIGVFTDEAQSDKALGIQARSIMDMSATYDVTDEKTGEAVGALRRQGLKSILRDSWQILDASGAEIGTVQEDNVAMALIRRFLGSGLIPQHFVIRVGGEVAGKIDGRFNPFQLAYDVSFEPALDARLGVATVVLLLAIEGRQS